MEPLGVGMRSAESSPFSASFTFTAFKYFTGMILFTIKNKYSKSDSPTKLTTFPLALAVRFSLLLKPFLNREGEHGGPQPAQHTVHTRYSHCWAPLCTDEETEAQRGL